MSETVSLPTFTDVCVKCHRTLERLTLLALLVDAGAHVMPSPLDCDHQFRVTEDVR